ncbi:hypothetical protein ACU8KH_00424 [Lachancea thermotolerans]
MALHKFLRLIVSVKKENRLKSFKLNLIKSYHISKKLSSKLKARGYSDLFLIK